jgi:hypothetical protein
VVAVGEDGVLRVGSFCYHFSIWRELFCAQGSPDYDVAGAISSKQFSGRTGSDHPRRRIGVGFLRRLPNGDLMSDHLTPLGGTCSARFEPVRELFAAKLESGEDLGASVALNIDGEMVVDLWGGWADEARTVP